MVRWDISGTDGWGEDPGGEVDCGAWLESFESRLQSLGGAEGPQASRGGRAEGAETDAAPVEEFVWCSHNRCHRLPVRELGIRFERLGAPVRLLEAVDNEEAMLHYAVMGEEEAFGAKVWPMAYVAAARLAEEGVQGRTVLELGCGTGLVSLAARLHGAAFVLATDRSRRNLDLAKASARLNGVELEAELFDVSLQQPLPSAASPLCGNHREAAYSAPCAGELPPRFDFVVLSDALYWPEDTVAFARRVAEAHVSGSTVIVADGGRQRGTFLGSLRKELADLGVHPLPELALRPVRCPAHVYEWLCSEVRTASSSLFCEKPFEMVLRPRAGKLQARESAGAVEQEASAILLDALD
eukprot:CAMPEP_0204520890 /NCGR_PEP_ID=MMETSP0661-20131031/5498_1 /ASSEMBLY_ACC=CAM_ASM_000606 /TAXON_ID=109239 /ORGANISM="Alexandrium margalefi, Strain AMGDE01CS-322" /LENGTH=354 /DNA_ID=CAMNT_0051526463 /DNA_START=6 /DNA_END=1070 /DNA_ORIENTATION=-